MHASFCFYVVGCCGLLWVVSFLLFFFLLLLLLLLPPSHPADSYFIFCNDSSFFLYSIPFSIEQTSLDTRILSWQKKRSFRVHAAVEKETCGT